MAISSIGEFTDEVLRIRREWYPNDKYPEVWFRGVNDGSLRLLPGAYWRRNCDENSLVLSFRSMAPPLLPREPLDDWEWYFLMQHYGLPTRLLDWTENPLFALYFALEHVEPGESPVVWVLDPLALNALSGLDMIVVPLTGRWIDHWLPENCGRGISAVPFERGAASHDNTKPLAIFPKRHNPRIVAQRGTFTVHGCDETPLDALNVVDTASGAPRLERIDIEAEARDRLWNDLWALGVTKTSIYPEPQSVAEDLKRVYDVR